MRDPFTKQVLQDIASFNNRYLGGILANLFESHPELQEEIADSIIDAVAAKENDTVNKLLGRRSFPGIPITPPSPILMHPVCQRRTRRCMIRS